MENKSPKKFEVLEDAEQELINLSGVECQIFRIQLEELDGYSISCITCGDDQNPSLVLLHGYLGTSIIFFKLFKELTRHYKVYCLDLMGMGKSSRPEFKANGREEAEHFFVYPLELCRISLNIERMILLGHSFGGYVSGCYTERYPERVEKLILMSSIGVPRAPYQNAKEWLKTLSWKFRALNKIAGYLLKKGITPASILRKFRPISGNLVGKYVKKRWKNLEPEEMKPLECCLEKVNLLPGSGEFALKELFKEGGFAISPLCERLTNTPILFIYGDRDWMDPIGADMNAEVNSRRIEREIISNSGHHMYVDNPTELTEKIISGLRKLDDA